jgi:hypothetical protein
MRMNEHAFFSKTYVLQCPVWVIVDLKRFKNNEGYNSASCVWGRPGLGPFLPLFLSTVAADEFTRELDWKGCGAFELKTARDLHQLLIMIGADNVAVYLGKDKTRFYRLDHLLKELQSHLAN